MTRRKAMTSSNSGRAGCAEPPCICHGCGAEGAEMGPLTMLEGNHVHAETLRKKGPVRCGPVQRCANHRPAPSGGADDGPQDGVAAEVWLAQRAGYKVGRDIDDGRWLYGGQGDGPLEEYEDGLSIPSPPYSKADAWDVLTMVAKAGYEVTVLNDISHDPEYRVPDENQWIVYIDGLNTKLSSDFHDTPGPEPALAEAVRRLAEERE